MATQPTQQAPQFSPAGGEGSTHNGFTYSGGGWVPTPSASSLTSNPSDSPMAIGPNQLIVTGTKPEQEFTENAQDATQMIGANNAAINPQVQTGDQKKPGDDQKDMFDFMSTYTDPYIQALDKISATSDKATQNLIATIKAKKANQMSTINDQYDRLSQGLMSLGLSTGNINFTPDLVYGQIAQAENQRIGKLQTLDRDEATALLEAQQAVEEKDFKLLKERMDYIKTIKKSRLDLLKEDYETMSYESKIGELQAGQIYDELQKLPENKKLPFLQQIATKFGIPLTALTSQVSEITRDRANKKAGAKSSKKLTLTQINTFKKDNPGVADQITYGMTEEEVADIIYGEGNAPTDNIYGVDFSVENASSFGGKRKIWKLAQALGIERNVSGTKKDEIDSLFQNSDFVSYVQDMINQGNTIEDIIAAQQ